MSTLDRSDFDELWLLAVDSGDGLTKKECAAITAFREMGGGLLVTRDHQDLGSSVCTLGGVGAAHFFHTRNPDSDPARCCVDDIETAAISWPSFVTEPWGDGVTREPHRLEDIKVYVRNLALWLAPATPT